MSPINREALIRRHNPEYRFWDPRSPLSVGNGDFAFTTDFTGLQTCMGDPPGTVPRCTMMQEGWHSFPDAPDDSDTLRLKEYPHGERTIGYMTDPVGQDDLFNRLRINPHRFHLGKIGLYLPEVPECSGSPGGPCSEELLADHVRRIHQRLDLWSGILTSTFEFDGHPVAVSTVCHPALPLLSVRIESSLVSSGQIGLDLRFPYASHETGGASWIQDAAHVTTLSRPDSGSFCFNRIMDGTSYTTHLLFSREQNPKLVSHGPHHWSFVGQTEVMEFSILFTFQAGKHLIHSYTETCRDSSRHWKRFWQTGAAVSFEGSTDPRAEELERRVILSQYLLAIQSLGNLPPAETGLTCNSWYGKFHLEMHPWHAVHGLLWNRADIVERSLEWYSGVLPGARSRAAEQGYQGARWPKMTDPSGVDSPSPIGCLLCWQQPHLILFIEMLYRLKPSVALLRQYSELVFETAVFMADYPIRDDSRNRVVLGPPVIPVQENHDPEDTLNPLFELEYWLWGLKTAIQWKRRLCEPVPGKWEEVVTRLSPCPLDPRDRGRYASHENCSDTFGRFGTDHPSMLMAYGFLPRQRVDPTIMSNTIDAVLDNWRLDTMWGWDFPVMAMTFARLGRTGDAVDILMMESPKNTYMENGHNRQEGHDALPLYLPGNGALLIAVAMMAAGWDGSHGEIPGFPDDGSWNVTWEGLARYL